MPSTEEPVEGVDVTPVGVVDGFVSVAGFAGVVGVVGIQAVAKNARRTSTDRFPRRVRADNLVGDDEWAEF